MVIGTRLPWWNVLAMHMPWLVSIATISLGLSLVQSRYGWKPPGTPMPYSVAGFALAIFLAFRNSASYDRWWEGRNIEINLRQQLGERELPSPLEPEKRGIVAVLT